MARDPICPTCTKPITDEDAVMHHNCVEPEIVRSDFEKTLEQRANDVSGTELGAAYIAKFYYMMGARWSHNYLQSQLTAKLDLLLKDKLITQSIYDRIAFK